MTIHVLASPPVRRSLLTVAAAVLVAPVLGGGTAYAAVTCAKHGTTARVTLGSGDSAVIARSGDAIQVNGTACGTATVNNVDRIAVSGSTGDQQVTIDLSGGQFAPGATSEPSGTSEIEFSVTLGAGTADKLTIKGSSGRDTIALGTLGINVNGDDDADVTPTGVDLFVVATRGGNDSITGQATSATGSAFGSAITANGGAGADSIAGGAAGDGLQGGPGGDSERGFGGNDALGGGDGNDGLRGGAGADVLRGRVGADVLVGAGGKDKLFGGANADRLNSKDGVSGNDTDNGGAGNDSCTADPGDTLVSC